MRATLLLLLMVLLPGTTLGQGPAPLPSRWMAPPGVERVPHEIWRSEGPFTVEEVSVYGPRTRAEAGRVAVIVEDALYANISSSITQYQADLAAKGYTSVVFLVSGGTAEDLRTYLVGLYNDPTGLVGTLLVGNVPYIIYELMQDWDGTGGDPPEYEDFPCDLFFMDMDGTWTDDGAGGTVDPGNGKYDGWSDPDDDLEIWAGRMRVDTLPGLGAPADILNNYFLKNHLYRTGQLVPETPPASGLVYVDDDWGNVVEGYAGDEWCVSRIYSDVTSVYDLNSSPGNNATADDYKTNHMTQDYQLILLRSHGWPAGHGFYQDNRSTFGYVYASDYLTIDPEGLFYSLFVCSGCDFTAEYGFYGIYLGGAIAFNDDYGLVAWGSAKTGGMWNDIDFYTVLAEPNSFGAAFVNWFNESHGLYPECAPPWWYGMVLIGDAALIPNYDYFAPAKPFGLQAVSGVQKIDLSWQANSEPDLHYYNLYRGTDRAEPSFLISVGAPDTTHEDFAVGHDTTYTYWVTAVDSFENESEYSDPDTCTYVDLTAVAAVFESGGHAFLRNHPNPFNPVTEIYFSVKRESAVSLRVYDISGRCLRTLAEGVVPRGVHSVTWDGRDGQGRSVGPGVYLCRLERDDGSVTTRKLLLIK